LIFRRFGAVASSLTLAAAALLASAEHTLLAPKRSLALAILARVGNGLALRIGQEDFQAHVQANARMRARLAVFLTLLGLSWLTNDQGIPLSIRTQDQVGGLGGTLKRAMHLDFEQQPQLGRDMQMLAVCIQPDVAALCILAQLDALLAIGRLETWEATGDALLFEGEIPFERFIQSIRERLHRRGRNVFTSMPFEAQVQIIFEEELARLGIVLLRGCQHLVVQAPRVFQTGHQLLALYAVGIQAILKRSHALILSHRAAVSTSATWALLSP
jgi:hypothetical protein